MPFHFPITYRKRGDYSDRQKLIFPQLGCCKDISFDGIQLEIINPLRKESLINLKLVLPMEGNYCRISLDARVCWLKFNIKKTNYTTGVEFCNVKEDIRKVLLDFITFIIEKQKSSLIDYPF